jgi:hypothetical protein
METGPIRRKRSLSSEGARNVRQRGYDDALEFALAIGLSRDYQNDHLAKKDVIDPSGDAHSVKGGVKKWQVFLYGKSRFESDDAFAVMNGIGALLVECIDSFPHSYEEYQSNKQAAKERLRIPMRELAEKLQNPKRLRAFLEKSLFNGKEVSYLTVKQDGVFHVFRNEDVVKIFGKCLEVCNSRAISVGQTPEQKVLFRYNGKNLGELEMRNDSPIHYREIRFNMIKPKVVGLLFAEIPLTGQYNDLVLVRGGAAKTFGRWR